MLEIDKFNKIIVANWKLNGSLQFIDEYLTGDKYDYCIAIKNGDDLLKKYVLNWVLENLIPLSSKNLKSVFIISYEESLSDL